jgi:hypothetical protein
MLVNYKEFKHPVTDFCYRELVLVMQGKRKGESKLHTSMCLNWQDYMWAYLGPLKLQVSRAIVYYYFYAVV